MAGQIEQDAELSDFMGKARQAQRNFVAFGACDGDYVSLVRQPNATDERDSAWKPLPQDSLIENNRGFQMSGMTEAEAIEIAKAYVTTTMGKELKIIGANDKTKKRRNLPHGSSEWNVLFESMLPDGTVIESAIIVIVDETTKQARFFEGSL